MSTDRPGIIYLAVNRVNQKAYVGQTTILPISIRINTHAWRGENYASASYFQRALAKYGPESFDFAVLEGCSTKEQLNEREREWIKIMGSTAPVGYNIGAGGEGSLWDKRSAAWHAAVRSPETRQLHREQAIAWRASMTPEQRAAHNAKTGAANKGRPHPMHRGDGNPSKKPESRVRISEGLRRSWQDPEVRKRRAAAIAKHYQEKANA